MTSSGLWSFSCSALYPWSRCPRRRVFHRGPLIPSHRSCAPAAARPPGIDQPPAPEALERGAASHASYFLGLAAAASAPGPPKWAAAPGSRNRPRFSSGACRHRHCFLQCQVFRIRSSVTQRRQQPRERQHEGSGQWNDNKKTMVLFSCQERIKV